MKKGKLLLLAGNKSSVFRYKYTPVQHQTRRFLRHTWYYFCSNNTFWHTAIKAYEVPVQTNPYCCFEQNKKHEDNWTNVIAVSKTTSILLVRKQPANFEDRMKATESGWHLSAMPAGCRHFTVCQIEEEKAAESGWHLSAMPVGCRHFTVCQIEEATKHHRNLNTTKAVCIFMTLHGNRHPKIRKKNGTEKIQDTPNGTPDPPSPRAIVGKQNSFNPNLKITSNIRVYPIPSTHANF